ncbi:MAG: hypothetical protein ACI4IN_04115 [Eubacterium sp.]
MGTVVKNRSYSLFALLAFLIAVGTRDIEFITGDVTVLRACVFYFALAFGVVMLMIDSFRVKEYAPAFCYDNKFHIGVLGYLVAVGFFVDFVYGAIRIYSSVESGNYHNPVDFLPLCICTVLSLICSFYYVMVGLSFSSSGHDFKELKITHIAPILWIVVQIISVLPQAAKLSQDVDVVLKYIVLIFLAGGLYFFAYEVSAQQGTQPVSLFMFRGSFYTGLLFFFDQLMLVLSGSSPMGNADSILSVTVLSISVFMYFFEKNIIAHTN